ncbi:MAG TPA: flippase, partial [Ignavibacteriaceae bacterium]|nr:flippase [Ignavibacteriaceae bacterium]
MIDEEKINTKINFSSTSFKKYFINTSWLFSEKIFRVVLGLVVVVAVTNYLGAKNFGLYSYALSFTGIFSIIAGLGLDNILTRELIKNPDKQNSLMGTSFILKLSGAFISIILLFSVLLIVEGDTFTRILVLIIAGSSIFQSLYIIEFFFQSQVLAKYPVIVKSVSFFIASGIKLILIFLNASLIYFAIFTTFEFLILAIGLLIIYSGKVSKIAEWKFDKRIAGELLRDSWPLILSGLAIGIYMYIGQIMVTKMLGEKENGIYATAVKLCEAFYFIPMIITSSLFPAIVNAKKINEKLYLNRLQKLYDLLAWISIGIALIISIMSTFIIQLLYKPEYLPAAQVLTIYIWA